MWHFLFLELCIKHYQINTYIMTKIDKEADRILLATLAGIGAGIAAGVLLAPRTGRESREELIRQLNRASEDVNSSVKRWTANLKNKRTKGRAEDDEEFDVVMQGSWEDVKRQMRQNYDDLTDEEQNDQQGKG
ncbi:YtxH domain-containing protein [Pontibacter korlensis]